MKKTNVTMKKLLAGLGMAAMMLTVPATVSTVNAASGVTIDAKHFPDKIFRSAVSDADKDKNGKLSKKELANIGEVYLYDYGIKDLTGIEYFTNIRTLECENNKLTKLDVNKCTKLERLKCNGNNIAKLSINKCTKLETLDCSENKLTKLDVSKNTKLITLDCSENKLTKFDVSKNTKLELLACSDNRLTKLNLSKNTELLELFCDKNKLTELDLTKNKKLGLVVCGDIDKVIGYEGSSIY